jgi:hypothetical protein
MWGQCKNYRLDTKKEQMTSAMQNVDDLDRRQAMM